MDSKLTQDVQLEYQMNTILKQIDYQLEQPIECGNKCGDICKQCIYNVGNTMSICSK